MTLPEKSKTDLLNLCTILSMAVAVARIPATARVNWIILHMVMRLESEDINPELEHIARVAESFCGDTSCVLTAIEELLEDLTYLLTKTETLKADTTPVWEDTYNLCGDPRCDGECRICQEGEYDGDEWESEKYCRRGRR